MNATRDSRPFVSGLSTKSTIHIPERWDEKADVVIIGSGFAALAAAIEAKRAGSSVIIIEKRKIRGGNSMISGGVVAAAGSELQTIKGVEDSWELLLQDMLKAGLYLNYPDLVRIVAEKSNETLQWTINYLGVKYDGTLNQWGGHSVPRCYTTYSKSGAAIIQRQLTKLQELGGGVNTKRLLTKLLQDKNGRVKGIEIRDGYMFPNQNSGTFRYVKAQKAVVLATGGFGNDIPFRTAQDPRLNENMASTNQPGATAEALIEAMKIGAMPVQLSLIQLGPWTCPDEKGFGIGPWFAQTVAFQYGILVNPKTGKRFTNEMSDRKVRTDAIIETGRICIGIADETSAKIRSDFMPKLLKRGIVKRYKTLEELAFDYDIPSNSLKETIEKYNTFVLNGKDKEFGKSIPKDAQILTHPPFYAIRIWPKVHHTMGGVRINTNAQVIGLDNQPIKGLYAAGELVGGVHGACRLGGCAIVDCLVFGRIAGRNAAADYAEE